MEKHVTLAGMIRIGWGVLGLMGGLFAVLVLITVGFSVREPEATPILLVVALVVGLTSFVFAIPGIIGGIGLIRYKNWARYLVMVLSVIDLFNVPVGTIAGGYTLWVLLHDETLALFTDSQVAE